MRSKVLLVIVAVVLGGVAAFAAYSYLGSLQRQAEAGSVLTDVLVAKQDIPEGVAANDLVSSGYVETSKVPLRYLASGAISSVNAVSDRVLAVPVTKGEVLTTARFQYPSDAGLAFSVPKGLVAVAIPVDDASGLAGLLKAGDRVAVVVTVSTKSGQGAESRIALPGARVLAVGRSTTADRQATTTTQASTLGGSSSSSQSSAPRTVTLAVTSTDAEKLVLAAGSGSVWLALLPTTESAATPGPGQTIASVLR